MIATKSDSRPSPELWDDLHARDVSTDSIWERRVVEHFVQNLPKGSTVLVIACGAGEAARIISTFRADLKWFGVDYSQEAINAAASTRLLSIEPGPRLGKANQIAQLVAWESLSLMDVNEMPWKYGDRQFDAVIACDILQYTTHPPAVVKECLRVASKMVAASFPMSPETAGREGLWLFEPIDPWRMMGGSMKVHQLKEGNLLVAFARPAMQS